MSRLFRYVTLATHICVMHVSFGQTNDTVTIDQAEESPVYLPESPLVSGVHTLSIHVKDTITQDSVYQFLIHRLGLPVYYTPETYGFRRYAGLYAGNMVLEPCGPYPEIEYAKDNFRSIFFGMNFEVPGSLESSEQVLAKLDLRHQVNRGSIYIRDSTLCNENIFVALYEVKDKELRESLRQELISDTLLQPGIEYIKEIVVGYKEGIFLSKWKEFLHPLVINPDGFCQLNDSLQLRFERGEINEVKGITCKVKSLYMAEQYLGENDLFGSPAGNKITMDVSHSFGLVVSFTDEE
jgi:hypothetical protein